MLGKVVAMPKPYEMLCQPMLWGRWKKKSKWFASPPKIQWKYSWLSVCHQWTCHIFWCHCIVASNHSISIQENTLEKKNLYLLSKVSNWKASLMLCLPAVSHQVSCSFQDAKEAKEKFLIAIKRIQHEKLYEWSLLYLRLQSF